MTKTAMKLAKGAATRPAVSKAKKVKSAAEAVAREQKFWIALASKEHVMTGVKGCFGQACHGKGGPLARTRAGDWVIYYSPKENFGDKLSTCQRFTAIGQVKNATPYQVEMLPGFKPFRIDIDFEQDINEVKWAAVKDEISFASKLRFGFAEISKADFKVISTLMLDHEVELKDPEEE